MSERAQVSYVFVLYVFVFWELLIKSSSSLDQNEFGSTLGSAVVRLAKRSSATEHNGCVYRLWSDWNGYQGQSNQWGGSTTRTSLSSSKLLDPISWFIIVLLESRTGREASTAMSFWGWDRIPLRHHPCIPPISVASFIHSTNQRTPRD